jgi:putative transposase
MPLLANDDWRGMLAESLDRAMAGQSCRLIAYVFMPEHVHLLVQPTAHLARIDLLLKAIKGPFSSRVKRRLEETESSLLLELTVRERPGVHCFRFWQEGGGYDRNLWSEVAILAAIDYIHENLVRRGLCKESADWRWSSARHYRNECGIPDPGIPPTIHGLTRDSFV